MLRFNFGKLDDQGQPVLETLENFMPDFLAKDTIKTWQNQSETRYAEGGPIHGMMHNATMDEIREMFQPLYDAICESGITMEATPDPNENGIVVAPTVNDRIAYIRDMEVDFYLMFMEEAAAVMEFHSRMEVIMARVEDTPHLSEVAPHLRDYIFGQVSKMYADVRQEYLDEKRAEMEAQNAGECDTPVAPALEPDEGQEAGEGGTPESVFPESESEA